MGKTKVKQWVMVIQPEMIEEIYPNSLMEAIGEVIVLTTKWLEPHYVSPENVFKVVFLEQITVNLQLGPLYNSL